MTKLPHYAANDKSGDESTGNIMKRLASGKNKNQTLG